MAFMVAYVLFGLSSCAVLHEMILPKICSKECLRSWEDSCAPHLANQSTGRVRGQGGYLASRQADQRAYNQAAYRQRNAARQVYDARGQPVGQPTHGIQVLDAVRGARPV